MFGDVELTEASARQLLKTAPEFDYIITAEAKSIPLAYEMSRQSGRKYFIARKHPKLYMVDPLQVIVKSITTDGVAAPVFGQGRCEYDARQARSHRRRRYLDR